MVRTGDLTVESSHNSLVVAECSWLADFLTRLYADEMVGIWFDS